MMIFFIKLYVLASGEDHLQSTPKSRKGEMMFNHPMTPTQVGASPSAAGHPHGSEDFEMGSPPWPRTPASPVFNSHGPPVTPQDSYRTSKVKVSLNRDTKIKEKTLKFISVYRNLIA
jgi:hypothetical protein